MITVYEEYHDNRVYEQSYDNCDILMHIQRKTVQNFLKCFMGLENQLICSETQTMTQCRRLK